MNYFHILKTKVRNAKWDIPALVNNTVLFVLAWVGVFWVAQFFTILPAFSLGVKMNIYNSFIDFNSVNTASSDKDIWGSADNVYNIFLTPFIFTTVLAIIALIFLIKWNSDRLHIRRLLFWIIICVIIRVNGNFIFGHLFNLWSWNLVTDFMRITYPSMALRFLFIALSFLMTAYFFIAMSREIKRLFNPYIRERFDNLASNVFFPTLFGSILLVIWNLPLLPRNEILCLFLLMIMIVFFMCYPFMRTYKGIEQNKIEEQNRERINSIPLIILGILFVANVTFMKGRLLESSSYRRFFIENTIMIFIIVVLALTFAIAVRTYIRRMKQGKRFLERRMKEISDITQTTHSPINESPLAKNRINVSKYKNFLTEAEEETETLQTKTEDFEKFGYKRYNVDKYKNL